MKWLTADADSRRTIVTVCGMGGVGKTTLATNVYRKVACSCHFDCAAWVAVSRNFTPEKNAQGASPGTRHWKNVYDSLAWDGEDHGIGQVWSILNFSIDDLPYHLKRCFLYCSIFPEDMLIKRKILIREWIAQGLIEERGQLTMEEVADGYVDELVQRNLLLVALKNEYGRAKRGLIHDLIREVIVHRTRDDRFLQLSGSTTRVDSKTKKTRYLTLDRCNGDYHQSTPNMPSLRSLYMLRSEFHASLFSGLRLLTVLNLWFIKTSKLPGAVTNLRNLRYLGIRSTYIEELPKELGKLHNLQTLEAKWSMIKTLPSTITKLKNLRHLILFTRGGPDFSFPAPGAAIVLPDGLQNLRCLQTLKYVRADQKMVRSLGSLVQMRSLELFGVDETILVDLPSALSKMSCLVRLGIVSSDSNVTLDLESFSPPPLKLKTLAITGKLTSGILPSWFSSLTNLVQLYLRSSELREDSIGILSALPRLLHLSLVYAQTVKSLTFAACCFPVLRELSLQGLPNLIDIEFQTESLAYLRSLMLGRCPKLADVPKSIGNLMHLENLELFEMPSEFAKKMPDDGGDHPDDQRITVVKNIFSRSG
ncbi:hypothetical protein ACQ4PT_055936 [Festuca glaucescens]